MTTDFSGLRACCLNSLGCSFDQLARQTARDANTFTIDIGSGIFPALQRARIVDEVNADLSQNGFRIGFNDLQRFCVEDLEIRNIPFDIFCSFDSNCGALGPAGGTTTASWLCVGCLPLP